jgi:hypothetical protein
MIVETYRIIEFLKAADSVNDTNVRLAIIKSMFEYILQCDTFIAQRPSVRNAIIAKIENLRVNKSVPSLEHLFKKIDILMEHVASRDDYVKN